MHIDYIMLDTHDNIWSKIWIVQYRDQNVNVVDYNSWWVMAKEINDNTEITVEKPGHAGLFKMLQLFKH